MPERPGEPKSGARGTGVGNGRYRLGTGSRLAIGSYKAFVSLVCPFGEHSRLGVRQNDKSKQHLREQIRVTEILTEYFAPGCVDMGLNHVES